MRDSKQPMMPHEPVIQSADLPGVGGRMGASATDFRVDEVARYAPRGDGAHWFVRVQKTGRTTLDAVHALARATGTKPSDIGYAGMKDKHAVTTQWFSLPAEGTAPPDSWKLPGDIALVEVTRNGNKLRTGHLSGNRFVIRLVDVQPDAETRARAIFDRLCREGLVNYFGAQRFGTGGRNLAEALAWAEDEHEGKRSRFARKLFPSVLQAEVFNRYAALRVDHGTDHLIPGEVVRLDGSASVFVIEDPERERARLLERDIHLTGPIFGPKARQASGLARELEEHALSALDLSEAARRRIGRLGRGTRRDLLVFLDDAATRRTEDGLEVSFFLPAGSYATQVIRELTRGPFWGARLQAESDPSLAGGGEAVASEEHHADSGRDAPSG